MRRRGRARGGGAWKPPPPQPQAPWGGGAPPGRAGARARALPAHAAEPDADFWVGLEGGVDVVDDQLMAFAWMAIKGRQGDISEARSATLPLPPAVKELVASGMELGAANDRVFATVNSKQGGGAYGLLTDGRYTREGIYAQTLVIALTPFVNALYPQFTTGPR